ncbi:hypothetical protein LZ198_38445 [Myxococcus sp. K15C18031901]|uniref:hypothetical protein n=1 Tax=Myxococcus dinghuensis TaxID=2906761 RepID=UPI0020A7A351|nr:hypothetical protein [Myxococcus dinghuensis]MCP3104762.1 hypothetical protein [Myxococcus dinghuensis]
MAPLSPEDVLKRFLAAREAGDSQHASPTQLRLLRELIHDSPAFTPAMLELARLLQLADEPGVEAEASFTEVQRLLEQAVRLSRRGAPALVELGYFLDVIRGREDDALALWDEAAQQSLKTLEQAWAGMLRAWADERTKESLEKALRLAERARKVFPDSLRILDEVEQVHAHARQDGLLEPATGT